MCYVFVPHTTAAVTINENADEDVKVDILNTLSKLIPYRDDYRHMEGNSDAHVKATLTGSTAAVIVQEGKLVLGTWQSLFFCEFDGPRKRKIMIKVVGDK
jgi:secondary thiamine-phosphate synthase enzyme